MRKTLDRVFDAGGVQDGSIHSTETAQYLRAILVPGSLTYSLLMSKSHSSYKFDYFGGAVLSDLSKLYFIAMPVLIVYTILSRG